MKDQMMVMTWLSKALGPAVWQTTPTLQERLATLAHSTNFKRGQLLLSVGQAQTHVYLIVNGLARSFRLLANGEAQTRHFWQAGDFLAGESFFMDTSQEAHEALEDLQVLQWPADQLRQLVFSDLILTRAYAELLEKTLRYKISREISFQNQTAAQRYLTFKVDYPQLARRLPQYLIASYLGVTKESFSRLKKQLNS